MFHIATQPSYARRGTAGLGRLVLLSPELSEQYSPPIWVPQPTAGACGGSSYSRFGPSAAGALQRYLLWHEDS